MKCYHCAQEIDEGVELCPYCGSHQGAGATTVLDQVYNPYAQDPESGRTEPLQDQQAGYAAPANAYAEPAYNTYAPQQSAPYAAAAYAAPAGTRPVLQLATTRGLLKYFLLSLITFGIYGIVTFCKIVSEINIVASRYDGRRTMPFFAMVNLTPLTLGILPFVWYHNLCDRIGNELNRRGISYKFGASTFWLWSILGSLILVGPFVFAHKFLKAMNLINADFNVKG